TTSRSQLEITGHARCHGKPACHHRAHPASATVASSFAVLTQLGRYHVDDLLARGGMGEVYRGRIIGAHGFSRPIVIKVIRTELVADERVALMFVDEARIAAGLHHRNIVQIVDFDLFDGGAFLACEYVDGCDLRALLHHLRAPPRYDLAVAIIAEIGTGLEIGRASCRER